ncbi:MAG: hypothetical protein ING24_15890 [Roseomonas sp.]|nr:hypothetical protein [Roseomonas sp.]MCA3343904.1 hypothetical protein [Roseomonas sp.]
MNAPPPRRPDRWLRAALATLGFGLLVAGGIADHGGVGTLGTSENAIKRRRCGCPVSGCETVIV